MILNPYLDNLLLVLPYAGELTLIVGILILLTHFTFLSTGSIKYYPLITYSTRTSIYLLALVESLYILAYHNFEEPVLLVGLILTKEILMFKIVLVAVGAAILMVSEDYMKITKMGYWEYQVLFLTALLGSLISLSANDLMILYISLEVQALAFYIMATIKKSPASSEAGLKYFIVGSFSSAILLFGISLVVLMTGHHAYDSIEYAMYFEYESIAALGAFLIVTAILIKLAVAPYHEWVADIYEGVMTPTALLFATIPKICNFFILVRLVHDVFGNCSTILQPYLALVAILSLIWGSLNAYRQNNIKRFLAFSSVNHFGFMLMGPVIGTSAAISASFVYLSFYISLTLSIWTCLLLCSTTQGGRVYHLTKLGELGTVGINNPGLAFCIFITLLSMGGIPPLAGFHAKVSIFFGLVATSSPLGWLLTFIGLGSSLVSVYYYLRLVKILTYLGRVNRSTQVIVNGRGSALVAILTGINIFSVFFFIY